MVYHILYNNIMYLRVKCSTQKNVSDTIKISARETSFTTQHAAAAAGRADDEETILFLCFPHIYTMEREPRSYMLIARTCECMFVCV